jgi:hypothetical protein
MLAPIVIDEHGDVSFYPDVALAARALEPIDVLNNEYVAYDSLGYTLQLVPGNQRVTIAGRASETSKPEALNSALRSFYERASGQSVPSSVESLQELLALCIKRFGYGA